jgi:hypothetical protein
MQKHILILAMALLAISAGAQVTKNNYFISANGNFSYAPPSANDVKVNGSGTIPIGDDKSASVTGSFSFGWFIKENRTLTLGIYGNYNSATLNSQYAYNVSDYSTNESDQRGLENGFIIGTQKFHPVWKDKFFITVNTDLSLGYSNSENSSGYSFVSFGNTQARKDSYKNEGFVSRFTIGAGAYFFLNKHWGLTSRVSVFNLRYNHLSNTTSRSQTETTTPFFIPETTVVETKNVTNTFTASLNPFVQPFSLVWGVSYFF